MSIVTPYCACCCYPTFVWQGGQLTFNGRTPHEIGMSSWRSLVAYVGQARVNFKGTPAEFYFQAQRFESQKGRSRGDLPALIHEMGLEQLVLNQPWVELSVRGCVPILTRTHPSA